MSNSTYQKGVKQIAENVQCCLSKNEQGFKEELANSVFTAVCEATDLHDELIDQAEADEETGLCNNSRAQSLYPNFSDYTTLGDWQGYDYESVQALMQAVFNQYVENEKNG